MRDTAAVELPFDMQSARASTGRLTQYFYLQIRVRFSSPGSWLGRWVAQEMRHIFFYGIRIGAILIAQTSWIRIGIHFRIDGIWFGVSNLWRPIFCLFVSAAASLIPRWHIVKQWSIKRNQYRKRGGCYFTYQNIEKKPWNAPMKTHIIRS